MKMYTVAGVSRLDQVLAFRTSNDENRAAVLVKLGHADVQMVRLPRAMNRQDAAKSLMAVNFANGVGEIQSVLAATAKEGDEDQSAAKPKKVRAAKVAKAAKPAKVSKKAAKKTAKKAVDNEPVMTDAELAAYIEANMRESTHKMHAEFRTFRAF